MGLDWPALDDFDLTVFALTVALGGAIASCSYVLLNWAHG